ncbi:dihydroneopterin aldolase [Phyllobacterium salinisoli]|uniref:4-(hydroxymethyl)-2-furancarboxaldehyde-phosphate synthase n=1 Tax=Phyllobacterium salinisoli TaxID=1899321 RepID=A0A368K4Z3_9HYPH|nr:(5-formylfuran-3-yl)methyl phosphate synthase [Phyllobacterium salinisoli]RCS24449.1 dihydroneopterin aldolase [Phyllobacterium salinisoli]
MTKMLASVRDRREVEIVLKGGADIIDLKDPDNGALGAVAPETIRDVVDFVAGVRPVSAACGDLPMEPEVLLREAGEIAATGVEYVKIGFFPSEHLPECIAALKGLAQQRKLIGVLFADHAYPDDLPAAFKEAGFHGIMIDTANKAGGRLLDHLSPDRIGGFIKSAHDLSLMVGVAGSLEAPDIPRLLVFAPDFLGFRGALCENQKRNAGISEEATAKIRALIPEERTPATDASRVDYQLLAARGYFPSPEDSKLGTDKIFVRDFVLPVQIGAYSFEHGKAQKVRFDVTADVLRVTLNPEDMRHVVSYDLIMDGIRTIVARGHVELAETLAEQVAAFILENPRVTRVVVRAEKLELGAGGVGVEIERRREAQSASKPRRSSPDTGAGAGTTHAHGGRKGSNS